MAGVRVGAIEPVVRSRFEAVLAVFIVVLVATSLWAARTGGVLRFDTSAFSSSAAVLDSTVEALQKRPFDELAEVDSAKDSGPQFRVEYSVRRKKHELLEIQVALIDRELGTTVDRLVTWRARDGRVAKN